MASIRADFDLNLAPLRRGFAEADRLAKTHGTRMRSSFGALELAGVGGRARRAVGLLTADLLATGSAADTAAGAVSNLGGTFRGIGTGAGLAAAAAIGLIVKNTKEARARSKELALETRNLRKEMEFASPAEGVGALGGLLQQQRKAERRNRDEVGQFDVSRHPVKAISTAIGDTLTKGNPFATRDAAAARQLEAAMGVAKLQADIVSASRQQLAITTALIGGDETEARLLKLQLDYEKEINALRKMRVPQEAIDNATSGYHLQRQVIQDEGMMAREKQTLASKAGGLVTSSMTPAQQNISGLKDKVGLLRKRFHLPTGSEQDRVGTGIELGQAENELMSAEYAERNKSWAQRSSETRAQRRFSSFVRSQSPSTPNAYIKHPAAYDRHPDAYGGIDDPVPQGGRAYQAPSFTSTLGELNRHMEPYSGS